MFSKKQNINKTIIKSLKKITSITKIKSETTMDELNIDSLAWIKFIDTVESIVGKFSDLDTLIVESLSAATVNDLVQVINKNSK